MKSMYLMMVLCVSLVNAEDSGTGSEPTGTQPPSSNGSASDGVPLNIRERPYETGEFFISEELEEIGHFHGCARTLACVAAGGKCQTAACTVLQQTVRGGCTGITCRCCAPRACDPQPKCKKYGGFCALTCGKGLDVIVAGCTGTPCSCCARPCVTSDECQDWRGVCQRSRCSSGQHELLAACPGQGCHCCSPASPIRDSEGNNIAEVIGEASGAETTNNGTVVKQEEGEEDDEEGDEVSAVTDQGEVDGSEGEKEDIEEH